MSFRAVALSRRSAALLLLSGAAVPALAGSPRAQTVADGNALTVGGILAYLGVLPAAILRGHRRSHPEGAMHGGVPEARHAYHVILALFDAATLDRIESARITLTLMGLGHVGGTRIALEPMTIADTVTWGAYAELPGKGVYEMTFEVRAEGRGEPVVFPFRYVHSMS